MISGPIDFHVSHFKSLGEEGLHLSEIRPVNIIIGRNNSGKSAILDVIELLCQSGSVEAIHYHRKHETRITIEIPIPQDVARRHFPENSSGGFIGGSHWEGAGRHVADSKIEAKIEAGKLALLRFIPSAGAANAKANGVGGAPPLTEHQDFKAMIAQITSGLPNPFSGRQIVRLSAERDILPEAKNVELSVTKNGQGLTNTLAQILLSARRDSSVIEDGMLGILNNILHPDMKVDSIRVQEHDDGRWEIFLEEKDKGLISLSNSGSGLKTIILTVALLEVIPNIKSQAIDNTVFLLEELENNLHPAVQRRLLQYVRGKISDKGRVFITTHSSSVIDMFSNDAISQIIHVTSQDGIATAAVAKTHTHHRRILDDLDVRASDLLQSNGIVWLEGPSDRIYFNRWIDLFSQGALREGSHYQCVFYGGRLLSHLSADAPDNDRKDAVQIITVNRNAIVVMDSDKDNGEGKINATKKRISSEIESIGGSCWITEGREIENYISHSSMLKLNSGFSRSVGDFEEIEKYLEEFLGAQEATKLIRSKSAFADQIKDHISREDLLESPKLLEKIKAMASVIYGWNGIVAI